MPYLKKGSKVNEAQIYNCPYCDDGKTVKLLKEGLLAAKQLLNIAYTKGSYPIKQSDRYNKAIARLVKEKIIKGGS